MNKTLGQIHYRGMWQIAYKATNVLCADGRRRYATITSMPATWFSIPASVKVYDKTSHKCVRVSGYITPHQTEDNSRDIAFRAVMTGKNYQLLPNNF